MIAFEKSVGAVVFRRVGKKIFYLLLQYNPRYWGLPKGHVEKGETEMDTLRREIQEETGIKKISVITGFKKEIRYFYRAKGKERTERKKSGRRTLIVKKAVFYLAEAKTQKVKISFEHKGYQWLEFSRAFQKITYKNSKNLLRLSRNYLLRFVSAKRLSR